MFKYQIVLVNRLGCELFRSEVLTGYAEETLLSTVGAVLTDNAIELSVGDNVSVELVE